MTATTEPPSGAVRYELRDGAAWLTLDRPSRANALDLVVADALLAAIRRAHADRVGVIVLRSEGRFFTAGGDVQAFAAQPDLAAYVDDMAEALHRVVSELTRSPAIVVAAVQGVAAGAGTPLAAAADIVLAARSACFTLGYTKIGFSVDGGSSLLTATLGLHRALHLALLNPTLTAEEAQAAGLVASVHEDEDLDAAVEAVVQRLVAGSAPAQAATKRLLRGAALPTPEAALRAESLAVRAAAAGPDGREGVDAFVAKRRPVFGRDAP